MIYEISHTTTYEYHDTVSLSHHSLRLSPREFPRQKSLEATLKIAPDPNTIESRVDYFGNQMTFVTVEGTHRRLVVTSSSKIEVKEPVVPLPAETLAWEEVRGFFRKLAQGSTELEDNDLEAGEFVYPSSHIPLLPQFADYAAPSFPPGRPVFEAVLDLTDRIFKEFKFDPKATTVATPLEEVMRCKRGVCQDFAHLEIACLRSMGIPARYVSGYLETDPPPGKPRLAGADASHAWLAFYCPGTGWIDLDPTNNLVPSTRHITVAWGRDYGDVSPIRGVILGSGDHSLKVEVDVIPMQEPRFNF